MSRIERAVIEPVGSDLVALAQCHALDATIFPHTSLPPVFASDPLAPAIWIARVEAGGPVVGFVGTRAQQDVLEIVGLAVDPAHRRAGIGRALVRAAARSARARGLDRIALHVSTGNQAAIELYTREGFRKAELLPGFYASRRFPDEGNAYVMIREID
ncbi:MAG: GNAT family N-acetyltransferase [Labilithrix sp.]|nr:GNAT family N-acetyltransferase [Labilithrix sp.]